MLSRNQICIWAKRFEEFGIEGLKDKPKSGRKSAISDEKLIWLRNLVINESHTQFGYNTETWTAPILVKVVEKECNITYSDDMMYIILKKKLNLTHKKGKGFYPEADAEKRIAFLGQFEKNF